MKRAVYKYAVPVTRPGVFRISMPVGAEVISVGLQDNMPYLWAVVDLDEDRSADREFCFIGTGQEIPPLWPPLFVGTVITSTNTVGHLFVEGYARCV